MATAPLEPPIDHAAPPLPYPEPAPTGAPDLMALIAAAQWRSWMLMPVMGFTAWWNAVIDEWDRPPPAWPADANDSPPHPHPDPLPVPEPIEQQGERSLFA